MEMDTDYLVVGVGASGLAFADTLLAEANVAVTDMLRIAQLHRESMAFHKVQDTAPEFSSAVQIVSRPRLVAFLAGLLRQPASVLELEGVLPLQGPAWYVAFQSALGMVQFAIGLAMVRGYRRGGPWESF
jgi:hypothetical protein